MEITITEAEILVKALNSYIRRKIRDYNHDEREGADPRELQTKQARIEAAKELRERLENEFSKVHLHG